MRDKRGIKERRVVAGAAPHKLRARFQPESEAARQADLQRNPETAFNRAVPEAVGVRRDLYKWDEAEGDRTALIAEQVDLALHDEVAETALRLRAAGGAVFDAEMDVIGIRQVEFHSAR